MHPTTKAICLLIFLVCSEAKVIKDSLKEKPQKEKEIGRRTEGRGCDPDDDPTHYPLKGDNTAYLYCHPTAKKFTRESCQVVSGQQKIFDKKAETCLFPGTFKQYAAGSSKVEESCSQNTDCLSGMFCQAGMCQCLTNYVEREDYCYEKVDPDQTGCIYDEQCQAVWPNSHCVRDSGAASGTCRCPANYGAVQTRDGWVCVATGATTAQTANCPTPIGNGVESKLFYDAQDVEATCTVGSATAVCTSNTVNGYSLEQTYDCINIQVGIPGQTAGICCPSRALACVMPMKTTSPTTVGVSTITRWWYNSVTGTCEQFTFVNGGAGVTITANANNFETRQHCESYCLDTCGRGSPQFSGQGALNTQSPTSCSTTTTCDSSHECTNIGSLQFCCPTASSICSRSGGLSTLPATQLTLNYASGTQKGAVPSGIDTRWYYNPTNLKCETFSYRGQAGNFNNFLSQSDCQDYCEKLLCDQGSPIKDTAGDNLQCSSDSNCPSAYRCTNSVCCPRKQTVCAEPKQIGTCNRFVNRYWYNAISGECELFTYSGCQGNDNNFENLLECQNFCRNTRPEPRCIQGEAYKDNNGNYYVCSNSGNGNVCPSNYECYFDGFVWGCCPVKAYTCSLTSNSGSTCGPKTARWFYDTTTQSCQSYEYLGCNGNSNNFPTRARCESYCGVGGCPNGGDPFRDSGNNVRVCSAIVTCPSGFECNSVYTNNNIAQYCCPSRSQICRTPPVQVQNCGNTQSQTRYYYNVATKSCQTYDYYGCDTNNANNFATLALCIDFCSSSACNVGEAVFMDPNNNRALTCNINLQDSCPAGYRCKYDDLTGLNVCCGATDMGVCPATEKAFVDAATLEPRECTPNVAGTCYTNYLCRFNSQASRYYCCLPSEYCPAGRAVSRDANNNYRAVSCTVGSVINSCSAGYSCQTAFNTSTTYSYTGFCCSVSPICTNGGSYYEESTSKVPRQCTLGRLNSCPGGFNCLRNAGQGNPDIGYCCTGEDSNVCPLNNRPYNLNGNPVVCQQNNNPNACPAGYTCQRHNATAKTAYCCSGSGSGDGSNIFSTTDGCPVGQVTYKEPSLNTPRVCQLNSNVCPIGYNCQWSPSVARYQCCGVSAGCPSNSVANINPRSGTALRCNPGQACDNGFTCQRTNTGDNVCCSTGILPPQSGFGIGSNVNPGGIFGPGSSVTGPPPFVPPTFQPPTVNPNLPEGVFRACDRGTEFLYPGTSSPLDCSPLRENCPQGNTCSYSQLYKSYICCSSFKRLKEHAPLPKDVLDKLAKSTKQRSRGSEFAKDEQKEERGVEGGEGEAGRPMFPEEFMAKFPNLSLNLPQPQPQPAPHSQGLGQGECNIHESKSLGAECCDDQQCPYGCSLVKGERKCVCPRHLLMDITQPKPMCVKQCHINSIMEDGLCVPFERNNNNNSQPPPPPSYNNYNYNWNNYNRGHFQQHEAIIEPES